MCVRLSVGASSMDQQEVAHIPRRGRRDLAACKHASPLVHADSSLYRVLFTGAPRVLSTTSWKLSYSRFRRHAWWSSSRLRMKLSSAVETSSVCNKRYRQRTRKCPHGDIEWERERDDDYSANQCVKTALIPVGCLFSGAMPLSHQSIFMYVCVSVAARGLAVCQYMSSFLWLQSIDPALPDLGTRKHARTVTKPGVVRELVNLKNNNNNFKIKNKK